MDPFHVVALAGQKLDLCRQRVQQDTLGHRGRAGDPLYRARRTMRTRLELLTDKQKTRLEAVFADDAHAAVTTTWWVYQQLIAAYADPDRHRGKKLLTTVIDTPRSGLPTGLEELATLGRTLHRRRDDVLAYFTHRASNGPHRSHQRPPRSPDLYCTPATSHSETGRARNAQYRCHSSAERRSS